MNRKQRTVKELACAASCPRPPPIEKCKHKHISTVRYEEAFATWPVCRERLGAASSPLFPSPACDPDRLPFLKEILRTPRGFPLKTRNLGETNVALFCSPFRGCRLPTSAATGFFVEHGSKRAHSKEVRIVRRKRIVIRMSSRLLREERGAATEFTR